MWRDARDCSIEASGTLTVGDAIITAVLGVETITASGSIASGAATLSASLLVTARPTFRILLSGDMQDDTDDAVLLSGDMTDGNDHERHRMRRPRRTQQAIYY